MVDIFISQNEILYRRRTIDPFTDGRKGWRLTSVTSEKEGGELEDRRKSECYGHRGQPQLYIDAVTEIQPGHALSLAGPPRGPRTPRSSACTDVSGGRTVPASTRPARGENAGGRSSRRNTN
ncbi:uncharacterized protein LOC144318267 isoform X4 [Canis aureus]